MSLEIEQAHGEEMSNIIIESYECGYPAQGLKITEFNKRTGRSAREVYGAWKKLERDLFDSGKISHIENPLTCG